MRLLGLIGGTSWHSTIVYYRLINELVSKEIGTEYNPPLLLYSLNVEVMRAGDVDRINQTYLGIAQMLSDAGAKAIVICANTPHLVYPHVAPQIDIPILHIADATGREAQRLGLKKLGLLGNRPTMTRGFIQSRLDTEFGISTLIPESEGHIDRSHHFVSTQLTQGRFTDEARSFYLEQMHMLGKQGAEGIILGCTELPILLEQQDFDLPMLATTDLHAQMAAEFILET